MDYKTDLHVAMINNQLMWVGGVDVFNGEEIVTRFVFDAKPYDLIDTETGMAINNMTVEQFTAYKDRLQQIEISKEGNSKFISDFEDAVNKGLY
jgi:hypothetical protein